MAILFDGPVLPDDLTIFTREVPLPAQFGLGAYLPDAFVNDNRVDVGRLTKHNRMAQFRAYDANLPRAQRNTATVQTVNLPALSDSLIMGEAERLRIEMARVQGTNSDAFVQAIYNDAQTLTENIQHRMEWARGQVLSTGKLSIQENGLTLEADYGVPEENFVTPAAKWSDKEKSTPLEDLMAWVTHYTSINGFAPDRMLMSRQTMTNLLSNQSLRTAAGSLLGVASFLSRDQLSASLSSHGLPSIAGTYDAMLEAEDGSFQRVIPEGKVIFLPPAGRPFGRTVWGVSATALEIVNSPETQLAFSDAPGIVGAVNKSEQPPFSQTAFVDAVGMPVLDDGRALMVATVN